MTTKPKTPNYVIELMPIDALITHAKALQEERAELEHKLAEQQAWMEMVWDELINISVQSSMSAVGRRCSKILANPKFDVAELNNLLEKAKEEGRKEALTSTANKCKRDIRFYNNNPNIFGDRISVLESLEKEIEAMLAAAPKP